MPFYYRLDASMGITHSVGSHPMDYAFGLHHSNRRSGDRHWSVVQSKIMWKKRGDRKGGGVGGGAVVEWTEVGVLVLATLFSF